MRGSTRIYPFFFTIAVLFLGLALASDWASLSPSLEQDFSWASEAAWPAALGVLRACKTLCSPAVLKRNFPAERDGKRVRFVGDHQRYHCGSAAVTQYIHKTLLEHGFTIADNDYDIMLVNGEGSMCLGCPPFHSTMRHIKTALKQRKRVHLLNTVWQQNPYHYDDVLTKLCSIVTRQVLSQRELRTIHGADSSVFLDFSFFSPLRPGGNVPHYGGKIVMTDFAKPRSTEFIQYPSNELVCIDMRSIDWSDFVLGLKTANVLVTGRHHGVYAAMRARIPFVAMPGNSHKIEGLIASANIPIPLIHSFDEIPAAVGRVASLEPLYRELFDWAEAQPKWTAALLVS